MENYEIRPIAHIYNALKTKFGVPRQSGLVPELISEIVFEPEFSSPEAVRGIEGFSHIWLIWSFSEARRKEFSPTVRPPRLGGNVRMGVFATRSPYRPNSLALSCVRLLSCESANGKTVLKVAGADLKNGTPIYDIKPYLPYADCIPDADSGFAADSGRVLCVEDICGVSEKIPEPERAALFGVLSRDPRPQYQNDSGRVYGMEFCGNDIRFRVENETVFITDISPVNKKISETE